MVKKVLCLIGKTASGKDTAAKYLKEAYGIKPIVSFTTRPMQENETDGVEHWFIDDAKMDEIMKDEAGVLAYTQFPKTGIRYCASMSMMSGDDEVISYIIDPPGVNWMKEHKSNVETIAIMFDLDENIILERAKGRKDKLEDVMKRLDSEREIFDDYKESKAYDCLIDTSVSKEGVMRQIDEFMRKCDINPLS